MLLFMKAYQNLIKFALENGHSVSVYDGEEWSTQYSTDYDAIVKDVEGVEECYLKFHSADKEEKLGWALITPFEPDEETVCDYSITPFMEEWEDRSVVESI